MKKIIYVFLFGLSITPILSHAVSADRLPSLMGCEYGEGRKVCWVNISAPITNGVSPPAQCNNSTQIRWVVQSEFGTESTGEELYAMALSAVNTGAKLRINLHNTLCFENQYPLVTWMSIVPN